MKIVANIRLALRDRWSSLLHRRQRSHFPFGGQASEVIPCYNGAIYALLGPPIGGPYLWTPSTKTYQFGPPTHAGQWLLGNAGPPYFCLVSILPIITYPGTDIIMMGSSQ